METTADSTVVRLENRVRALEERAVETLEQLDSLAARVATFHHRITVLEQSSSEVEPPRKRLRQKTKVHGC